MTKVRSIISITPQAVAKTLVFIVITEPVNVRDPPVVFGTLTTRIE